MPDLVTMFGVSSSVIPMNPTGTPSYSLTATLGKTVSPVSSWNTLAERYWKSAPAKVWSGQEFWLFAPSPSGMQPPSCMRTSSRQPSSNSWLPTLLMSRPISFIASMVGSSWNAAESSGVAPIRSPAATVTECRPSAAAEARSAFRWVARYSAPPAKTPLMVPPDEEVLGSSCPWKSFSARICSFTSFGGFGGLGGLAAVGAPAAAGRPAARAGAATLVATRATEVAAARPRAASLRRCCWGRGMRVLHVGCEVTESCSTTDPDILTRMRPADNPWC